MCRPPCCCFLYPSFAGTATTLWPSTDGGTVENDSQVCVTGYVAVKSTLMVVNVRTCTGVAKDFKTLVPIHVCGGGGTFKPVTSYITRARTAFLGEIFVGKIETFWARILFETFTLFGENELNKIED